MKSNRYSLKFLKKEASKILLGALCFTFFPLQGQTIAEKKSSFFRNDGEIDPKLQEQIAAINELLQEKKHYIKSLYDQAQEMHRECAPTEDYQVLLQEISKTKKEIVEIEEMWRDEMASCPSRENYSLWHQPNTTVLQLIMDYGAQEYVYLVPPEIGAQPVSINSNLPIPKESWKECLALILESQGIGLKQLNPFLRELYYLRHDASQLQLITSDAKELDTLPKGSRICFVLTPHNPDPRGTVQFIQKFCNPSTTTIHTIGGDLYIISQVETIKEILKLYDFLKTEHREQDCQLVSLFKMQAKEMETIINSAFNFNKRSDEEGSSLRVVSLASMPQSLFLFGSKEEVAKATKLMREVESQLEDPQEKTVFWYTIKHSDPEELAEILSRVYDLLKAHPSSLSSRTMSVKEVAKAAEEIKNSMIVKPISIDPTSSQNQGRINHKTPDGQHNFIVDTKTSSIIMVVEREALPKIKEILKRLDVPKKMVQLEVLLFEKKVNKQNSFGLNLLRLGSAATNAVADALTWNVAGEGILKFFVSRSKGSGIPAYDLAYQFLLGQEDVQINASPSVMAINQTPAKIAIVEEISINTGFPSEKEKRDGAGSFSRAQYGITIQITPTINMPEESDEGEESGFVTLDTDITFDTTQKNSNDRPDVTRRHIKNHVRIADGQTVILGGLRRKTAQDSKDTIPFLGEIPGLGKLFSTTEMNDSNTEMFIFITPKIISDPSEDLEKIRREELKKRPGDIPEFVHELLNAKEREKKKAFEGGLTALFGRKGSSTTPNPNPCLEYEGK